MLTPYTLLADNLYAQLNGDFVFVAVNYRLANLGFWEETRSRPRVA